MNPDEHFNRAVAMLPDAVRERLDGDSPLDWTALEDAGTGAEFGAAVRACRRLPRPVEMLVHRLIRDVGVVPADVAAGAERQGAASAWIHWITIETDGDSYLLRNDRSGEVHTGVRPEAVAGYATLGMELATLVHDTGEQWLEAGEHHEATAEAERSQLAQCAVRMRAHLRAQPETIPGRRTAASLARTLEYAWNSQSGNARAALAGTRLSTARGARAPRRSYYSPMNDHRLHACDAGEIRWLRALAQRAGAGAGTGPGLGPGPGGRTEAMHGERRGGEGTRGEGAGREAPEGARRVEGAGAPVVDLHREGTAAGTLELGSDPDGLMPDIETAELERTVNRLPDPLLRRMGEVCGAGVAEALARFRSPREVDAVRAEAKAASAGGSAPRWLEVLAAALLRDTGAQARDGMRTAGMRLDPRRHPDGLHRVTEVGTGAVGHLGPAGVIEQVRLGLAFAHDAWAGLNALQRAAKEGAWTLSEAQRGAAELSAGERDTLEAAREIEQALERILRSHERAHRGRAPSALELAGMAAETLRTVGPTARTAAGWPGAAEAPDPRDPEDVARIAAVGEGLHAEIRTVANRLIAGRVAGVQSYGEGRKG